MLNLDIIQRMQHIPQGLSAMPGNRPESSPPIPVFRPQMAMATSIWTNASLLNSLDHKCQLLLQQRKSLLFVRCYLRLHSLIVASLGDNALTRFGKELPAKKEFEHLQKARNGEPTRSYANSTSQD